MTLSENKLSDQRKSALIAGTALVIMAFVSFFSFGYVHGKLVVPGNANSTFNNIMTSKKLFKAEIFGWFIILISDILVAWAFYIFLKPINKNLSLLAAWLRLSYSFLLGIAIMNLIFVLLLTKNMYLSIFKIDQLQAQMMLYLGGFESIWSFGLIIFGGHLLIVGLIALKSDTIPKIISILLLLGSIGYIVIHLFDTFLPQYDGVITILNFVFTVPMIIGELSFGIWLLLKGGKVHKMTTP
jgi:hypothetical protein